jgi:surface protein
MAMLCEGQQFMSLLPHACTSVIFCDVPVFDGASEVMDLSFDGSGSVLGFVYGTVFYVSSLLPGTRILANSDSSMMFLGKSSLTSIDFGNLDVSLVRSMRSMFYGCAGLTSLDLSFWDISLVEDMRYMFMNCYSLVELDITGWNLDLVLYTSRMFKNCVSLKERYDLPLFLA